MRLLFALLLLFPMFAHADEPAVKTSYADSLLGEVPKLPAGFDHYPWVNPDAPKGGEVSLGGVGTFDNFNPFILRGRAAGVGAIWQTLTEASPDEVTTAYGVLAQTIERPADDSWVAFDLRPEARFSDGTPVTSDDVKWSFDTLREKGRPTYAQYWGDVDHVETDGPGRVVFRFKTTGNRELHLICGELTVLPKHWFAGRDFTAPLTDAPIGSGPYKIGHVDMGRTLTLDRVQNWWGEHEGFGRGRYNFDQLRTEYFRDPTVLFEAFKGGQIDYRRENSAKTWATGYDFPAVAKALVIKQAFAQKTPQGTQGFMFNTRRPIFQNVRVRHAIALLLNFEWTNKTLFYGLYHRTTSMFEGSDFAESGLPAGAELALLEPYRATLPSALFTTEFKMPVTDGSGNDRAGLKQALDLLRDAGWTVKDRKLVDASGNQMHFEIMLDDPNFERVTLPFADTLRRIGIDAQVRTVDPAQAIKRQDAFDFDMTVNAFGFGGLPGNEQADLWTCAAKDNQGSSNFAGVCDPIVDTLVHDVIVAKDMPSLLAATHALDRVLLWDWFMVPNWRLGEVWTARWNRFGFVDVPIRAGLDFDSWWVDPALAAKTDAARGNGG